MRVRRVRTRPSRLEGTASKAVLTQHLPAWTDLAGLCKPAIATLAFGKPVLCFLVVGMFVERRRK